MLYIPRLRDVLKKLETTSDLARNLIKRANNVVVIVDTRSEGGEGQGIGSNQEHAAHAQSSSDSDKPHKQGTTSSTQIMSTTTMTTSSLASTLSRVGGYGYVPKQPPTGTNEIKMMRNKHEKNHHHQPKTIRAALFSASLFSRAASNGSSQQIGGAVILESSSKDLREQQQQQKKENNIVVDQSQTIKQNQSSYNMSESESKKEEVAVVMTQHQATTTNQLDETTTPKKVVSCNGASCGSNDEKSEGKEKPCFQSSLADILHFMELVGNLKHTKRTGWVLRDVNDCESISGHMYRMSMMTFLLEETEGLNRIRCMELALVHDLAESLVGDLTPFCGVAKEDKKAMELNAMADICKLVEPRGKRIMELFEEYEEGQSAESKFVKDLDRLDMVMQAFEYEKRDNCLMKHQEFFDSTEGKFQHPFIQKLVKEICDQRKSLVEANVIAKGELNLKTVTSKCPPCLEHKMEHHKNERS